MRARVTDLAGNEGTSPAATVQVSPPPPPWTPTDLTWAARSGYAGLSGWTSAADGLLYAGDVTASHPLDLNVNLPSCGCQNRALSYHSQEAAPAPVVQARLTNDAALGLPAHVYGTLTWDGARVGGVDYDVSKLSPGGDWVFSYPAGGSPATGRHTYTLDLFVDYAGTANDHAVSVSGQTFVVNRSGSPYGAGWAFSNADALVSVPASGPYPAGVLREFGRGGWAFYADAGAGQYTGPAGDGGSLVAAGGGWTYTSAGGEVSTFDAAGRMTAWFRPQTSETVSYTYDPSGGVATVAWPDGGSDTFAYSGGKLSTITAPGSRVTTLTYTGSDLTRITDPAGGVHAFGYDGAHRLTCDTQGAAKVSYAYDSNGLASGMTLGADPVIAPGLAAGIGTAARAGPFGSVAATYTDALGYAWTTWYNPFGQPVRTLDPVGAERTYERDADGYIVKYTDALDRVTTFAVDAAGRVLGETRADGTSAAWAYGGANGSLTAHTDFNNEPWAYTNDANGNRLTATDLLNHTTSYTYQNGLLRTATDPTGSTTTYLYDTARRPVGALVGGAVTGTVGYDAAGNPNTYTDPLGNVTTAVYDGVRNVVGTVDPLGDRTTSAYDAGGLLLWTSDGLGHVTSFAYDTAGRVTAAIEAYGTSLQRQTTYVYDAAGQLIATVDPLGNRTTAVYDPAGRVIATIDPLGNRTTLAYDLEGEPTAAEDPLGRVTEYHYDLLGRPDAATDPLGNTATTV